MNLGRDSLTGSGRVRMIYLSAVSMYQYMSLTPIGCPQKASNVGCISVWRDRAFACGLASRSVRVRQHPGRADGGFTYSEYRCFTMLAGHDLRTLSSLILTLKIELFLYPLLLTVDCRFRTRPLGVVMLGFHGLEIPDSLFLRTAGLT